MSSMSGGTMARIVSRIHSVTLHMVSRVIHAVVTRGKREQRRNKRSQLDQAVKARREGIKPLRSYHMGRRMSDDVDRQNKRQEARMAGRDER